MSLGCLACHHRVESPSHSFRSYSVSSSENDGRCSAITSCLAKKITLQPTTTATNTTIEATVFPSAKVTPQPSVMNVLVTGPPRLVRSRAVRRDLFRDWNFDDEVVVGS